MHTTSNYDAHASEDAPACISSVVMHGHPHKKISTMPVRDFVWLACDLSADGNTPAVSDEKWVVIYVLY